MSWNVRPSAGLRTALLALALVLFGPAGMSGGCTARPGFQPMPSGGTVFFRLDCSLGTVSFVGQAQQVSEVACPRSPQMVQLKLPLGEYRLRFEDGNDTRNWTQWIFFLEPGGAPHYWGDIRIVPGLAEVTARKSSMRDFERRRPELARPILGLRAAR